MFKNFKANKGFYEDAACFLVWQITIRSRWINQHNFKNLKLFILVYYFSFLSQSALFKAVNKELIGWLEFFLFTICWPVSAENCNELRTRQTNGQVGWKRRGSGMESLLSSKQINMF